MYKITLKNESGSSSISMNVDAINASPKEMLRGAMAIIDHIADIITDHEENDGVLDKDTVVRMLILDIASAMVAKEETIKSIISDVFLDILKIN